jgi:hypothetical protein
VLNLVKRLYEVCPQTWCRRIIRVALNAIRQRQMEVIIKTGPEVEDPEEVAKQISELISYELSTMLAKTPEEILGQMNSPYTLVAFSVEHPRLVVGFVTLWSLYEVWFELGSLVVRNQQIPSFRGRGIATELVWEILQRSFPLRILATAKTAQAINALTSGGTLLASFNSLPLQVHMATCVCTGPGEGGNHCPKADGPCRLLLARKALKR